MLKVLERVASDVQGPMQTQTPEGHRYSVGFTDVKSGFTGIYGMRHKNEILHHFKTFRTWIEKQSGQQIKSLVIDGGREYTDTIKYCTSLGIDLRYTTPHTPENNATAEQKNRTIMDAARAMLHHSGMPKTLWGHATRAACYIQNRCSRSDKTPYKQIFGHVPRIDHIRIFGCSAWVHVPKADRQKLDPRSIPGALVGYEDRAYLILTRTGRIICSRDVTFNEKQLYKDSATWDDHEVWEEEESQSPYNSDGNCEDPNPAITHVPSRRTSISSDSECAHEEVDIKRTQEEAPSRIVQRQLPTPIVEVKLPLQHDSDKEYMSANLEQELPINPRRSTRERHAPTRYSGAIAITHANIEAYIATTPNEPQSYKQAIASAHSKEWHEAMHKEYNSLLANETWTLAPIPKGRKTVS